MIARKFLGCQSTADFGGVCFFYFNLILVFNHS